MSMKIDALVPARCCSKGLPLKNIKMLHNKPLINYSIEAGLGCPEIEKVYLSSDNEEYLNIAESCGALPILRSKEFSSDSTTMKDVVANFEQTMNHRGKYFDAIVLLYPVYPLRNSDDLSNIIKTFKTLIPTVSLVGMKNSNTHPFLFFDRKKTGKFTSVIPYEADQFYRRQQYPHYYELSHWACVIPALTISKLNSQLLNHQTYGYLIPDDIPLVNIDTLNDFLFADFLLNQSEYQNRFL